MDTKAVRSPVIIAVCGKGGVGKTCMSALIVKALCRKQNNRVLAIDADPASGLAPALGVGMSRTVDDIRNGLIQSISQGHSSGKAELVSMLEYEMFSALSEHENLAFLAIGRPETEGCYCQVNSILKEIIGDIAGGFDYVVIDGEAGIEQINRRVMEKVTHLLLVADTSARAVSVASSIMMVACNVIDFQKAGLILNRVRNPVDTARLEMPSTLDLIGKVPEDEVIRMADLAGMSLLETQHCAAFSAVADLIDSFTH